MKIDGQCHCGAIAYEAQVEPGSITICHCADCQQQSGSAFRANISAPAASFRLTRGEPQIYEKVAASGAHRVHAFCATCGAAIYACAPGKPEVYSLRTGMITQRHELGSPRREIWMRRRMAWLPSFENTQKFDGQP